MPCTANHQRSWGSEHGMANPRIERRRLDNVVFGAGLGAPATGDRSGAVGVRRTPSTFDQITPTADFPRSALLGLSARSRAPSEEEVNTEHRQAPRPCRPSPPRRPRRLSRMPPREPAPRRAQDAPNGREPPVAQGALCGARWQQTARAETSLNRPEASRAWPRPQEPDHFEA